MILSKKNQISILNKTIEEINLEVVILNLKKIMEIEITEIDTENLIMNLMQLLKVKVC